MAETTLTINESDPISAKQVAKLLRLPVPTVYYLAHEGTLPSEKNGRRLLFNKQAILALIWDKEPQPPEPCVVLQVGWEIRWTFERLLTEIHIPFHDFPSEWTIPPTEIAIVDNDTEHTSLEGFTGRIIRVVKQGENLEEIFRNTSGPLVLSRKEHLDDPKKLRQLLGLAA